MRAAALLAVVWAMLILAIAPLGDTAQAMECADIAKVRAEAGALLKQGKTAAAIELLEKSRTGVVAPPGSTCDDPGAALDTDPGRGKLYWLYNDLSRAYLAAGRDVDCLNALAGVSNNPASKVNIEDSDFKDAPVAKALARSRRLCQAHLDARLRRFRSPACPFKVKGSLAAIALPATAKRPASCLVLLTGKGGSGGAGFDGQADLDKPAGQLCPKIGVATRTGTSALSVSSPHTELTEDGNRVIQDPLADTSFCCLLDRLAWAPGPGNGLVRVGGGGRDCFGGTALADVDTLYRWQGDGLERQEDLSIGLH